MYANYPVRNFVALFSVAFLISRYVLFQNSSVDGKCSVTTKLIIDLGLSIILW